MAIGTAGYTAMLCVMALERHGIRPIAARRGDGRRRRRRLGRDLAAVEARLPRHRLDRAAEGSRLSEGPGGGGNDRRNELSGPAKPLARSAGPAASTRRQTTLANVLSMTSYGGAIAACGLAAGMDLPATFAPFILRGVSFSASIR